jgi:hypothetical protein
VAAAQSPTSAYYLHCHLQNPQKLKNALAGMLAMYKPCSHHIRVNGLPATKAKLLQIPWDNGEICSRAKHIVQIFISVVIAYAPR